MAGAVGIAPRGDAHGLGIVVGSTTAARWFADPPGGAGPSLVASGGDPARARAGAQKLVADGAQAIFSFGAAVGLAPLLRPGDLVIAACVVLPSGETITTDIAWRTRLAGRLRPLHPRLTVARLAGRDRLPASSGEKRAVFQATFAAALDSESHVIAEAARAAGLPFLAVRAVADPAEQNRPAAACRKAGGNGYAASLLACLVRPWELPSAWRFDRNGRAALASLREVAALGPGSWTFGG